MSGARWHRGIVLAVLCMAAKGASAPNAQSVSSSPTSTSSAPSVTQQPQESTKLSGELGIRVQRIDNDKASVINWSTVISSLLAAFVGAGGALIVGLWSQSGIRRSLSQSANAAELKELEAKLNTFYGPYMQRSEANRLLAEEFKSHQPDPVNFRTLILLLDPAWKTHLSNSDQTIVGEIVENDIALSKLIHEHAGIVEPQVLNYLARASVHFRFIELAFKGKLDNTPKRFDAYVYPKQLDEVLRLEIKRLTDRCETLRRQSTDVIGPMSALAIPQNLALAPWPK